MVLRAAADHKEGLRGEFRTARAGLVAVARHCAVSVAVSDAFFEKDSLYIAERCCWASRCRAAIRGPDSNGPELGELI